MFQGGIVSKEAAKLGISERPEAWVLIIVKN